MRRCKSDAYEAIYEEVLAEFEAGLISEAERKKYDEICLVQEPETAYNEMPVIKEHITA
jgi:DNA-binding transcriptional regulator YiaG